MLSTLALEWRDTYRVNAYTLEADFDALTRDYDPYWVVTRDTVSKASDNLLNLLVSFVTCKMYAHN